MKRQTKKNVRKSVSPRVEALRRRLNEAKAEGRVIDAQINAIEPEFKRIERKWTKVDARILDLRSKLAKALRGGK